MGPTPDILLSLLAVTSASLLDHDQAHYHAGVLGDYEPGQAGAGDGPGEGGAPLVLEGIKPSLSKYGMAMEVSDRIALNRSIPDLRTPGCRYWHYPIKLPKASVVLVFHNEGFSVLLRTIVSILNR